MAIVYSDNVIEIAVIAEYAGRPHVNVLHYRAEEGVGVDDEGAVLDFANNWQDHIVPHTSAAYVLQRFDWRSLDMSDSNVGTLLPDGAKPVSGTVAVADALPGNVAWLIKKNTASRPRGRRDGRIFLAGVGENQIDASGQIPQAQIDFMNTSLQAFYDGVTDNPVGSDVNRHLVVLETTPASRAPGTQTVSVDARRVTSLTLDPKVATQRDRLR